MKILLASVKRSVALVYLKDIINDFIIRRWSDTEPENMRISYILHQIFWTYVLPCCLKVVIKKTDAIGRL